MTCPVEDAWLVAGPPGVYLVIESTSVAGELSAADAFAARVRVALADHLTLAPYVHPLLVSDDTPAQPGVSVVTRSRLRGALTEGLTLIDAATLDRIREVARHGLLQAGSHRPTGVRGWMGAPSLH